MTLNQDFSTPPIYQNIKYESRMKTFQMCEDSEIVSTSVLSSKVTEVSTWGFPGGAVVGSPPANAGDTGSRPGPGRSHMPRSN